jgi:hypothetical protein
MITNSNRSSSDRTTQLRRRLGWVSYSSQRPLNTYSASHESYISSVIAGRISAAEAGCCTAATIDDDIYIVGYYEQIPLKFYDSNDNLTFSQSLISPSVVSCYLVKYNKEGIPQWAAKIGSPSESTIVPSIVIDTNGDILLAGKVTGTQLELYNESSSTANITLSLDTNTEKEWLAKYNKNGIAQWATYVSSGSVMALNIPCWLSVDIDNNVYMLADYNGSDVLVIYEANNGASVKTYTPTGTDTDSVLIKYTTDGAFVWASKITSTNVDYSFSNICDKNGNVYAVGLFGDTLSIYNSDDSLSSISLTSSGTFDIYIIKYDSNGIAQWATNVGGVSTETRGSICVDSDDSVYITCEYNSDPVIIYSYNNISPPITMPNSGGADICFVKYNTNGVAQWATKMAGSSTDRFPRITVDSYKNIIITGITRTSPFSIYNASDVSTPAAIITPSVVSGTNSCVFLVSYNSDGNVIWATHIDNTNITNIFPIVTVDQYGSIYVTSEVESDTILQIYDAGGSSVARTLASLPDSRSTFIVKYSNAGISSWVARIGQFGFRPCISTQFKAAF